MTLPRLYSISSSHPAWVRFNIHTISDTTQHYTFTHSILGKGRQDGEVSHKRDCTLQDRVPSAGSSSPYSEPQAILAGSPLCDLRQRPLGPQTLLCEAREATLDKVQESAQQTPELGLEMLGGRRHVAGNPCLGRVAVLESEFSLARALHCAHTPLPREQP